MEITTKESFPNCLSDTTIFLSESFKPFMNNQLKKNRKRFDEANFYKKNKTARYYNEVSN